MFEWETLQTRQFAFRETASSRRMVVDAAATGDRVPERSTATVARLSQSGHPMRAMVWEIAGDATDCIVYRGELRKMGKAMMVFCAAVCRFGEVWERFARARTPQN